MCALEGPVRLGDVFLPVPLVHAELLDVLVALVRRRMYAAGEEQNHLEDRPALGGPVVEGALRVILLFTLICDFGGSTSIAVEIAF